MILGEAFHRRVVRQIADHLNENDQHVMLVFDPANFRYVTGLSLSYADRPVAAAIWENGKIALFVPQADAERLSNFWIQDIRWYAADTAGLHPMTWIAREAGGPLMIDTIPSRLWESLVAGIASEENANETDTGDDAADDESDLETVGGDQDESEAAPTEEIPHAQIQHSTIIEKLRAIKESVETELIEQAAGFADLGLERAYNRLTSGVSEREIAAEVEVALDRAIQSELGDLYEQAVPTARMTIASGTHAAWPTATTSTRQLTRGDLVIVDCVVSIGGYHAHAGSTFFVGDPLRDVVAWVETAQQAQLEARKLLKPGSTSGDVDTAVSKTIDGASATSSIRPGSGHGTGLRPEEAPWLNSGDTTKLAPGMVVVNRPGIYVSGRTGARHTETVLITEGGPRVLNPRISRWDDLEARLKEF